LIQNSFSSKVDFTKNYYFIESDNTRGRSNIIKFDIISTIDNPNALVGYVDTSKNVAGFGDLAYIFHMENGVFDARNDTAYAKLNVINTKAGTKFHVKLIANPVTKLYDIWIAP
jgi:hypothetical protein